MLESVSTESVQLFQLNLQDSLNSLNHLLALTDRHQLKLRSVIRHIYSLMRTSLHLNDTQHKYKHDTFFSARCFHKLKNGRCECGDPQVTCLHVVCDCEAGWMY